MNDSCPSTFHLFFGWSSSKSLTEWNRSPILKMRKTASILFITLFIVGNLGNLATFVTLVRYHTLRFSTRLFFFGVAIGDLVGFFVGFLPIWYTLQSGKSLIDNSKFLCFIYLPVVRFCLGLSSCNISAVIWERFLMIKFTEKMLTMNHKRYSPVVATAAVLIASIVAAPNVGYGIHENCSCVYQGPAFFENLSIYFLFLNSFGIMITATSTAIMIYCAMKKRYMIENLRRVSSSEGSNALVIYKMAICVCFCKSITLIPSIIITCLKIFSHHDDPLITEGADALLFNFMRGLILLNFGTNFFNYILVGRGFRKAFLDALPCRKTKVASVDAGTDPTNISTNKRRYNGSRL